MSFENGLSLPSLGYITAEDLKEARMFAVDSEDGAALVGREAEARLGKRYDGLAIPYYLPSTGRVTQYRVRRAFRADDEKLRYVSAKGARNQFWVHPKTPADWLLNAEVPIFIIEGELKATAITKYFWEHLKKPALVLGVGGAWNWRGKIGLKRGPTDGHVYEVENGPIPDWDLCAWSGRSVTWLGDANIHTNPRVRHARREFSKEAKKRGALVKWCSVPEGLPVEISGFDDFLSAYGEAALDEIFETKAREAEETLLELTDRGFLDRLYDELPESFFYIEQFNQWFAWNGRFWNPAHGEAELADVIAMLARLIFERDREEFLFPYSDLPKDDFPAEIDLESQPKPEAPTKTAKPKKTQRDEMAAKFDAFCAKYRNIRPITGIIQMARLDPRFRRVPDDLDSNPWLLNLANGTLDLKTGELKEPEPGDLITKIAPTGWNESAESPTVNQFFQTIFQADQEMIDYVLESLGYSLTGDNSGQYLFIAHGSGQNGKSVLFDLLAATMGRNYVRTAQADALESRTRSGGHTDELASLAGGRVLIFSELREGAPLDEARVKRFTDQIFPVSRKGEKQFDMKPGVPWMLTNPRPEIKGGGPAIWRRMFMFPFPYVIPDGQRVLHFEKVLLREAEGFLLLLVRGLHRWLERGEKFIIPKAAQLDKTEYQESSDDVQAWIGESCSQNETFSTPTTILHEDYLRFNGRAAKYKSVKAFSVALFGKGFNRKHTSRGNVIPGLALLANSLETNEE